MTPEQKERIRNAAKELADALSDARERAEIRTSCFEVTNMDDEFAKYVYSISVHITKEEVID